MLLIDLQPILHVVLQIVTSEWFGVMVLAPSFAWLIDKLFKHQRGLKENIAKLMLSVQKEFPDWDGPSKRNLVVGRIRSVSKYAANLPEPMVHALVDAVFDEMEKLLKESVI